jgi:hypothetical protein
MKKEMEQILKHTPYESYTDLCLALARGRAKVTMPFEECRRIAAKRRYYFSRVGYLLGFVLSALMTLAFAVLEGKYYLLWILPLELSFPILLKRYPKTAVITYIVTVAALICILFSVQIPLLVFVAYCSWLISYFITSWWQGRVRKICRDRLFSLLFSDDDEFIKAFNSSLITIVDSNGNVYDKEKCDELEREEKIRLTEEQNELLKLERLWEIVKVALAPRDFRGNIYQATRTLADIYIEEGKNILTEMYSDKYTRTEMLEKLNEVIEIGLGVKGVDQATEAIVNLYRSFGVAFPDELLS